MPDRFRGEPIKGELHSTDASAGVLVTIYNAGSLTARTLAVDEYIEVTMLSVVSAPGGDVKVIISTDATLTAGEVIARGTYAPNGGIVLHDCLFVGPSGGNVYVNAPSGVVDVIFDGAIRKTTANDGRKNWKESLTPGH